LKEGNKIIIAFYTAVASEKGRRNDESTPHGIIAYLPRTAEFCEYYFHANEGPKAEKRRENNMHP
jgi:hypothetical protein